MATKAFLSHPQTGSEFEVVKFDKATNVVTLKGEYGTFDEPFDKEQWTRLGYKMITREVAENVEAE